MINDDDCYKLLLSLLSFRLLLNLREMISAIYCYELLIHLEFWVQEDILGRVRPNNAFHCNFCMC